MKMTIRKDNSFNRHYRDEHCQIHKLKFFRFPEEVFKHPPQKNPQHRNTHVFQGLRRGVNILSDPTPTQRDTKNERCVCVASVVAESLQRPSPWMTKPVGKRCGVAAIFWGVEGDNCDVFEKSFCGAINIGGGCLSGVLFGR